jgi:Yip1 domain
MIGVFVRRLIGAAMLDSGTYEEVEADRGATVQAIAVVVLASLAAGVGARGAAGTRPVLAFFAVGTFISLAVWAAFAALTYQVGSRVLPVPETRVDTGELLRTLGFAAAPGLLQVFAVFTGLTIPIFVMAIGWTLVASVVAVRQALDYSSTRRAVAVCAIAWLLALLIGAMFTAVVAFATAGPAPAPRVVQFAAVTARSVLLQSP